MRFSEREFKNTIDLFKDLDDEDIERLIVHLQYIRQIRKRKFQETRQFNFCDKCQRTYPAIFDECEQCQQPTRPLPIYVKFAYLIDGPEQYEKNPYYLEARKNLSSNT